MTASGESCLMVFESRQHEQIRMLVEPLLAQADHVHDPVSEYLLLTHALRHLVMEAHKYSSVFPSRQRRRQSEP
jgi:hypothetical protein